jgi:hypothetical protein
MEDDWRCYECDIEMRCDRCCDCLMLLKLMME